MFLHRLNNDEKLAFIELAHHIARSDNDFSSEEQTIINTYCLEMGIEDITYNENDFNLDSSVSKLISSQSQKIVLMEIMALIYSDGILHEEEKKILDFLIEKFDVSSSLSDVYKEWSISILSLYKQGEALVAL